MLEYLNQIDISLFLALNSLHNDLFDVLMVYVSSKLFWLPFYLFLLYLVIRQYKWKTLIILLFVAVLIAIRIRLQYSYSKMFFSDYALVTILIFLTIVHTVEYCGGQYGFVSSHATNYFGIIVFLGGLLINKYKWLPWVLVFWGLLIIYSRIYLGVHYPGDVIGGTILGAYWLGGIMGIQVYR